ncbi:MAG: hypothetical protein HY908_30345 [Myxococcales bacterium]|nr:hypothetical protein [Myxococcales bacterium]
MLPAFEPEVPRPPSPEGRSLPGGLSPSPSPLDAVAAPVARADFVLTSGRRYELDAARGEGGYDRLTVRGRGGEVVLEITVGERGPVLRFASCELEVEAARAVRVHAPEIELRAAETLRLESGGDLEERVAGGRHARVAGDDRLEAGAIQTQASRGAVEVRARDRIALDGEHIGLNDDPCPQPFGWTDLHLHGDEP